MRPFPVEHKEEYGALVKELIAHQHRKADDHREDAQQAAQHAEEFLLRRLVRPADEGVAPAAGGGFGLFHRAIRHDHIHHGLAVLLFFLALVYGLAGLIAIEAEHEDDQQQGHKAGRASHQRHGQTGGADVGLGHGGEDDVAVRFQRGGEVAGAREGDVAGVAVHHRILSDAVGVGVAADVAAVGMVGDGGVFLVDCKDHAAVAHADAGEDVADLHVFLGHLKARGDDGDLHKAVGVVLLVAQGDADVLMEIAGYIVGLGFLHEAVHAEQQLVELVGLILGIIADGKARVGRVGGYLFAGLIKDVDRFEGEDAAQLSQLLAVGKLGVGVDDEGGDLRLVEVEFIVLRSQFIALGGVLVNALGDLLQALVVAHRLTGERKDGLHVERNHEDGNEADQRHGGELAGHGSAEAELAGNAHALFFAQVAKDEEGVGHHQRQGHKHGKEDDGHGSGAGGKDLIGGNGAEDVGVVVQQRRTAVESLAADVHPAEAAVFKRGDGKAHADGVLTDDRLVRVIEESVVLGRDGETEAVEAHGDVFKSAGERCGCLEAVIERFGVLFHHDHGVLVDARAVVAVAGVAKFHLKGGGGFAIVKDGAQLVEAAAGKVRRRISGLGQGAARLVEDDHIVHVQQVGQQLHIGAGIAGEYAVLIHESGAADLAAVLLVERLRDLHAGGVRGGDQLIHLVEFFGDVVALVIEGEVGLHIGQQHADQGKKDQFHDDHDRRFALQSRSHARSPFLIPFVDEPFDGAVVQHGLHGLRDGRAESGILHRGHAVFLMGDGDVEKLALIVHVGLGDTGVHAGGVDLAGLQQGVEVLIALGLGNVGALVLGEGVGVFHHHVGDDALVVELLRQQRAGVGAVDDADVLVLQVADAAKEGGLFHHDDGVILIIGGGEVEVFLATLGDGVCGDDDVHLAVQEHVLAGVGRDGDVLHAIAADALGKLGGQVDLKAVVLAGRLVVETKVDDVIAHADAQRLRACSRTQQRQREQRAEARLAKFRQYSHAFGSFRHEIAVEWYIFRQNSHIAM